MNDQQREALRRALNALKAAQRGDLDSQWNREAIADVEAALTQPQAQQAIKQDLTTEQQAAAVPAGLLEPHVVEAAALAYEMSPCHDLIGPMEDALRAAIAAAPPAPVLPLSAGKWEVRVAGPDDVHILDTEIDALRQANEINKAFVADCLKNPDDHVLCVATVHGITAHGAGGEPT